MAKAEQVVSDVVWEEPGPARQRRYDWSAIAAHLQANPGEWARIFERDRTSLVNAIRQGAVKPLDPALGFEVRTRNNVRAPDRVCTLYMRYVPKKG